MVKKGHDILVLSAYAGILLIFVALIAYATGTLILTYIVEPYFW